MTNILLSAAWYPVCIAAFFRLAFEARDDVEVTIFGPSSGEFVPWPGGPYRYEKYAVVPDLWTPLAPGTPMEQFHPNLAERFDLIVQVDAAYYMLPPDNVPNVLIATDPHCIDYSKQREFADYFFNMQPSYMQTGDILLPYAYCPRTHYPEPDIEPEYDVIINGLEYPQRKAMAEMLMYKGRSVHQKLGDIWDEYRIATAKARVVYTHSSRDDLIARVFETMAMKKPLVTNRTTHLQDYFWPPMECLAFPSNNLDMALKQIEFLLDNPDQADAIAQAGYYAALPHTYDDRVQELLEVVGV